MHHREGVDRRHIVGMQVEDRALLAVIGRLGPNDSGEFFDHRGEPVPW